MRNPYEVANEIKSVIPEKFWNDLETVMSNLFNAPEVLFRKLSIFVDRIISRPISKEWEIQAIAILTNKSVKETKAMINA